jgi:hypothetical protein
MIFSSPPCALHAPPISFSFTWPSWYFVKTTK